MNAHGKGCTCDPSKGTWADENYYCPWGAGEYDLDSIPRTLDECRVCMALTGDHQEHMRWHEARGHLDG